MKTLGTLRCGDPQGKGPVPVELLSDIISCTAPKRTCREFMAIAKWRLQAQSF
jgi:hypothetical protein